MDGLLLPFREYFPAAVGDNVDGSAHTALNLTAATNPTAQLIVGTHTDYPVLTFPDGVDLWVEHSLRLPDDLYVPGGLTVSLSWTTPATSGSAKWFARLAFAALGDTLDPEWNPYTGITAPADATANVEMRVDFAALDLTGMVPGARLFLLLERTPSDGDDDLADDANLIGIEYTYQRRVVLP